MPYQRLTCNWRLDWSEPHQPIKVVDDFPEKRGRVIATIEPLYCSAIEANTIASAPKLYNALDDLVGLVTLLTQTSMKPSNDEIKRVLKKACDALAAADSDASKPFTDDRDDGN